MIFWHVGGTILAFRYVFRDPNVDLRFLALGSILPDLIDKPLGTILFADTFQASQIFGHSLAFSSLLMAVVLLGTRRGIWRRRLMAVAVGSFFHLALDAMWTVKETFMWPAFGWSFPPGPTEYWTGFIDRLFGNPWTVAMEVAGLGYLIYLWRKAGLQESGARVRFWRSGSIQA